MLDHHGQKQGLRDVLCACTDTSDAILGPLRVQVGNSLQRRTTDAANEDKDVVGRSPDSSCLADQVFFERLCDLDIAFLKTDEASGTTFVEQLGGSGEYNMLSLLELMQDPFDPFMQNNASMGQEFEANEFHTHDENNHFSTANSTTGIRDPLQRKKRNQNQSRARQRQEVRLLRDHVRNLEDQRKRLFDQYKIHCQRSSLGEDATKYDENCLQQAKEAIFQRALSLKRSAERAKEEAERAQVENSRLRGLIEQQCQVARQFGAEFHAKNELYTPTTAELASVNLTLQTPVSAPPAGLPSMPERLEQDLDAQCQQLSSVWRSCGFTGESPTSCLAKARDEVYHQTQDKQGNRFWENLHSRILPFSPESVARAVWECLDRGIQTPSGGEVKVCKASGNMVEILLRDTFPEVDRIAHGNSSHSTPVRLSVRTVMKKFVEASRVVLVWSSVIEIELENRRSAHLRGKGWSLLQYVGVHGRSNKDKLASCFVQTCMRVLPAARPSERVLDGGEVLSTVPFEFIENYRQTRDLVDQLVENQLVDDCLRSLVSTK
ncbi:hypothetical protein FI667_g9354, partial [Globisporangium splendens]